jgi:hypothetical protein
MRDGIFPSVKEKPFWKDDFWEKKKFSGFLVPRFCGEPPWRHLFPKKAAAIVIELFRKSADKL